MNKTDLLKILEESENILSKNNIDDKVLKPIFIKQKEEIENFVAKILFVGGFSVGKSALLNSFLGDEEILKEDITPETAIATELVYGENEQVIRVKENGEELTCKLNEVNNLPIEGFYKYIYVLNNDSLKKLKDIVLVDMPGFDSNIEAHNKALIQYIGSATGYVFVLDLEYGTIPQSSLDFLNEIKKYSDSFLFILNKKDKLTESQVEEVTENIRSILETAIGKSPLILVTSIREDGLSEKLYKFLCNFSPDSLLLQRKRNDVISLLLKSIDAMKIQLSAIEFNPRDIDREIENHEYQRNLILNKMKHEKSKLHDNFQNDIPAKILKDVEDSLRSNIPTLIDSAKSGSESLRKTINNILRSVLIQSAKEHVDAVLNDYISSISKIEDNSIDVGELENKILATFGSVKKIAESGKTFLEPYKDMQKYSGLYKLFSTTFALTTHVIAPWLELIVIFLPEIIGLFNKMIEKSKEEKMRQSFESQIIPQICDKLRPIIREDMLKIEEEKFAEIEKEFQTMIDSEISVLNQLKSEKEQKIIDVNQKKVDLSDGIKRLEEIIGIFENL